MRQTRGKHLKDTAISLGNNIIVIVNTAQAGKNTINISHGNYFTVESSSRDSWHLTSFRLKKGEREEVQVG